MKLGGFLTNSCLAAVQSANGKEVAGFSPSPPPAPPTLRVLGFLGQTSFHLWWGIGAALERLPSSNDSRQTPKQGALV